MNIDDLSKLNYIEILLFVFAIFSFLVIINILGINLNTVPPPTKLIQEVTVESFENPQEKLDMIQEVKNMKLFPIDSFCESYVGKSSDLEGACERLTKDICLETNCCVYTGSDKCVAGSKSGPTYLKNNEGIDHYYYQNKKFVKK